jgi:hypothetical protein
MGQYYAIGGREKASLQVQEQEVRSEIFFADFLPKRVVLKDK